VTTLRVNPTTNTSIRASASSRHSGSVTACSSPGAWSSPDFLPGLCTAVITFPYGYGENERSAYSRSGWLLFSSAATSPLSNQPSTHVRPLLAEANPYPESVHLTVIPRRVRSNSPGGCILTPDSQREPWRYRPRRSSVPLTWCYGYCCSSRSSLAAHPC
jgi:hypothetical protein